jgi:hypothetical protein
VHNLTLFHIELHAPLVGPFAQHVQGSLEAGSSLLCCSLSQRGVLGKLL